jgi:hypothetical protein
MIIEHYDALPPVRSDPHWPQPCHHRLHSPRPHPYTAIPTARDSNLDSVRTVLTTHDTSRLSALAYLNDSPIHGLTDISLRLLPTDIGCGTLDPRSRQDTAAPAARDSNLGSGNHDMPRLSALGYLNDLPIHGLTDILLRLLPTDFGCGTLGPRTRRDTATPAARDSNLGSGNHDMSRLSTLAYLNDSPIHGLTDISLRPLPTDFGCGALGPRSQTRHGNTHCSRLKPRQW